MKLINSIKNFNVNNEHCIKKSSNLVKLLGIYYILGFCSRFIRVLACPDNNYLEILSEGVVCLVIFLLYMKHFRNDTKLEVWPKSKPSVKSLLYILSFTICIDLVTYTIMDLIYLVKGVEDSIIPGTVEDIGTDAATIVRAVLFGPIVEELIFRGAGLSLFKKDDNKWEALLFTSIFFGLFHGNFAQAINSTMAGFIYGYTAIQFGLGYAILFHVLNNGIVYLEYFLNIDQTIKYISIVIIIFHIFKAETTLNKLRANLNSQTEFSGKRVWIYFCDITVILFCAAYIFYIIKSII